VSAASTIWHSLDEGFFMFWQTLWALILGFALSGLVQAFVSRRQMQRVMGDHRPAAIVRSSLLGMASSSCSYAASALARSLFARGADFTAAMVFMVASTNLVLELGIVLWLLIGWQFAAAEFVGGAIMIALLALILPRVIPATMVTSVRARLVADAPDDDVEDTDLGRRVREPARWASAAGYTISDLRMLRREIVIGFVVAGFLAIAVPTHVWNDVFLHGHGAATTIENAAVAPGVAVISFVCSIGNVPLAAALWQHGISFGGVVAFVFADLIAAPLLLIYRKLYGGRLTVRLLGTFWLVMSTAGLLTELIFRALGAIPHHRPRLISPEHFAWNYTTWLNLVFLVVLAGLIWIHAHRDRFGPNTTHAHDPVCGMQVERANPGAVLDTDEARIYFCSGHCQERYLSQHSTTTTRTP
jgi:uncharacterized membrane protein YraQ (UPF0718 family)/YHS domain-containing protein